MNSKAAARASLPAEYSFLVRSAILTPHAPRASPDRTPTSSPPRASSSRDTTPTPSAPAARPPTSPLSGRAGTQPRRRRRSSVAQATSPVPLLKTRSGVPTPALLALDTAMAMSAAAVPAPKSAGVLGRLRSGSVGTALRAGARRLARRGPAPPPPSVPLPPLPPLPTHLLAKAPAYPSPAGDDDPFGAALTAARKARAYSVASSVLRTPPLSPDRDVVMA